MVIRRERARLSEHAIAQIRAADTFFVATASPDAGGGDTRGGDGVEGVDVSHRGGAPGFVRVLEEDGRTVLTSPDFRGNNHFNTLGNIATSPRAGLLFVDFERGGVLSLTGDAEVIWEGAELDAFAGAERLLRIRVSEGVWLEDALPLRFSAPEPAPQLARLGSREGVARALARDDP